jgi:hypothetical protein
MSFYGALSCGTKIRVLLLLGCYAVALYGDYGERAAALRSVIIPLNDVHVTLSNNVFCLR